MLPRPFIPFFGRGGNGDGIFLLVQNISSCFQNLTLFLVNRLCVCIYSERSEAFAPNYCFVLCFIWADDKSKKALAGSALRSQ